MTTWNKAITIEEATKLYKSPTGMYFPDTEHNRNIMSKVVSNHLKILRNA